MADDNTKGGGELPENASVDEAVELMSGFAETEVEAEGEGEREQEHQPAPDTTNAQAEGDGTDEQDEVEPQEAAEMDAPEFWSAEDKAAWAGLPAELKPLVKKYEQQRIAYVNEKAREAAQFRDAVATELHKATDVVNQAAAWWQQAGPALNRAFADKWSQVDWAELAEKNPAEWARLNQLRSDEAALLQEANRRGQADIVAAQEHAKVTLQEAKGRAHQAVAAKYPDWFGTPQKSAETYQKLGDFLYSRGIPLDQINLIHEAPIIELALMAFRFAESDRRASAAITSGTKTTGNAAPRRVQPGPPSRGGNRTSEAARQVGERFRKSGGASIQDAADLIRLSGL